MSALRVLYLHRKTNTKVCVLIENKTDMKRLIKYIEARRVKYGFWDGKKANIIDREHTIVRNIDYVTFLSEGSFIFYLYILLCYVPFSYIWLNARRWYRIKTGKLIYLDKRH